MREKNTAANSTGPSQITILHISDTQFGQYHRFGAGLDSLAARLIQDLDGTTQNHPKIDLLIVSGDIAETGKSSEYQYAEAFLREITERLQIPDDHIILVPGNHDVNWNLCKAHYEEKAAYDLPPLQPYAEKWRPFDELLLGITQEPSPLPYRLYTYPDLGILVAALNSTMQESHEDHWGFCGEEQLRWFQQELQRNSARVNVAVLHHNVRRKAEADNENLRDEDLFTAILGPHIDLVLHGHTHNGKRDYLSDGTLVLSTGSAAVTADWRPDEVANQYQIITIADGRNVTRRARVYQVDESRWIADARLDSGGEIGIESVEIATRATVTHGSDVESVPSDGPVATTIDKAVNLDSLADPFEIDQEAVREFRELIRPEMENLRSRSLTVLEFLARLGVARDGHLLRAAALMFAVDHQPVLPSAVVQCAQYFGKSKDAAERQLRQFAGPLITQVNEAYSLIQTAVISGESVSATSPRSESHFEYPMKCIREVLLNAVVHRDYSDVSRYVHVRIFDDRIEIASPGPWMGMDIPDAGLPLQSLISESVKRNPLLAHAMSTVRYFEGEGSGVPTAVRDAASFGCPEPQVHFIDGYVVVTIRPPSFSIAVADELSSVALAEFDADTTLLTAPFSSLSGSALHIEPRMVGPSGEEQTAGEVLREYVKRGQGGAVLIHGIGGAGKTTCLRRFGAEAASNGHFVPMYFNLRNTLAIEDLSEFLPYVDLQWSRLVKNARPGEGARILSSARALVLLDEMPNANSTLPMLIVKSFPRALVVVAGRSAPSKIDLGYDSIVELKRWTSVEAQRYLDLALSGDHELLDRSQTLWRSLELTEILDRPQLVAMAVNVFRRSKGHSDGSILHELMRIASETSPESETFYRSGGGWRASDVEVRLLREVCLDAIVSGDHSSEIPPEWLQSKIERHVREIANISVHPADLIERWLDTNVITRDFSQQSVRFTSRFLRDVMAAEAIAGRPLSPEPDLILTRFSEVYHHPDGTWIYLYALVELQNRVDNLFATCLFEAIEGLSQDDRDIREGAVRLLTLSRRYLHMSDFHVYAIDSALEAFRYRDQVERLLADAEQTHGTDSPEVLGLTGGLAQVFLALGRPDRARPLQERALAITERRGDPDDPEVAERLGELAQSFLALGSPDRARPLQERALAITEQVFGPDHRAFGARLNDLATVLSALGEPDRAQPLLERALEILVETLGREHPTVAICLRNLAQVVSARGYPEQAEQWVEQALSITEKAFGPNHPYVAVALTDTAHVFVALGNLKQAQSRFERALAITEGAVGQRHPVVAIRLSNLAGTLSALGHPDQAQPLQERALAITEQAYGPDHPDVATCLNNLAGTLSALRHPDQAQPLQERALAITEQAYGPDHPDVATCLSNLAATLSALGHLDQAQALRKRSRALGSAD